MGTIETDLGRNLEDAARRHAEHHDLDDHEPQAIERQIDATRADMRATLEALERRWSVERLLDLTVGRIRERGGEFAGNLTDAATQNPVPLLLTSVGVAWMMLTSRRGTRHEEGGLNSTRETLKHAAEATREALGSKAESLRDSASGAAAATRDRMAEMRDHVSHARERVDHARERMDRLLHEQPLMLGALGLAAGALIGALLPATEPEDRWLGDARNRALKSVARRSRAAAEKSRARYETARDDAEPSSAPGLGADDAGGTHDGPSSRPH